MTLLPLRSSADDGDAHTVTVEVTEERTMHQRVSLVEVTFSDGERRRYMCEKIKDYSDHTKFEWYDYEKEAYRHGATIYPENVKVFETLRQESVEVTVRERTYTREIDPENLAEEVHRLRSGRDTISLAIEP